MENKWSFVAYLRYAGHNVGVWIKPVRRDDDPAKFIFETKAEEMSSEDALKAQKEFGIEHYAYKNLE